eukprot:4392535-Heterocapsa_arctica.AAC.1
MQVPSVAKGVKAVEAIAVTSLTNNHRPETCRWSVSKECSRKHDISIKSNNKFGPLRPMLAHLLK